MDEESIQLPIGDGSSLVENYSLGIPFFPKVDYDSILPRSYFTEVSSSMKYSLSFSCVFNIFHCVILVLILKYDDLQRFHTFVNYVIGIAVLLVF